MSFSKNITDLVDKEVLNSIANFLSTPAGKPLLSAADSIAKEFGAAPSIFSKSGDDFEPKLIESFQKNLTLLIQKTWIEKADAELKENVLYKLSEYCEAIQKGKWSASFQNFLQIINDAVYLMFGNQSKNEDFTEYALRIDPEFGLFWLYIKNLPAESEWSEEKFKISMLLGMYFLANY